jgi:hypothetical protein
MAWLILRKRNGQIWTNKEKYIMPRKRLDLIGQKFGRLVVLKIENIGKNYTKI